MKTLLGQEAIEILGAELAQRIRVVLVAFKAAGIFYNARVVGEDGQPGPLVPRYTDLEVTIPQLFGLEHEHPLGFATPPKIDAAICHLIHDVDHDH